MIKMKNEFKQTEIGMIPEGWDLKKLKELLFIKGRIGWKGLKKSEFGDKEVIIINGPNIQNVSVNVLPRFPMIFLVNAQYVPETA